MLACIFNKCKTQWRTLNKIERALLCIGLLGIIWGGVHYVIESNDGFLLPHKWKNYTQDDKLYRRCVRHDGIQNYIKYRRAWAVLVECNGSIPYSNIYTDTDNKLRFEILPNG